MPRFLFNFSVIHNFTGINCEKNGFCSVEAESIFFSVYFELLLGHPEHFCIYGGGLWQHHQRPNALPICKPQPLFICICLVLYSNSLIAPPSVCHRSRMILRVLLFFGVSGSISIGYKVQGLKPGWSSSKNPPIWQHIGFSSHPSRSQ